MDWRDPTYTEKKIKKILWRNNHSNVNKARYPFLGVNSTVLRRHQAVMMWWHGEMALEGVSQVLAQLRSGSWKQSQAVSPWLKGIFSLSGLIQPDLSNFQNH